jgi:Tn7-like transposition protein D
MALETARGPFVGSLKYRLGILASHFRAHFPLKACIECMAKDRDQFGIAYWHRSHQLPGACVCTHHPGQMLFESRLKSTGSKRFDWILPEELHFRPVAFKPSQTAQAELLSLANAASSLAEIEIGWHFDAKVFAETMLTRLQLKGLASSSMRLKIQDIGREFHTYISSLHGIEEFQTITGGVATTSAQAASYFHRLHRITHPLRHLVMITWLYTDWTTFFKDYHVKAKENQYAAGEISNGPLAITVPRRSIDYELRDACIQLATIEGLTATAIANKLAVTVTTVISHLAASGISTPKRPKVLRGIKFDELVAALRLGLSKKEAAEKFGVSVVSVTRILLSVVGLHQEWVQIRDELTRKNMRLRWAALLSGNRTATQKLLRSIEPATFAWLYRNDREWLGTANQGKFIRPSNGGRAVNWQERDQNMFLIAQTALRDLLSSHPCRHVRLTDLISLAPQLKPYVSKLDALPKTQLLLQNFLRYQSQAVPDLFRPT